MTGAPFGIDLTSVHRPGGISDYRCARGLMHGLLNGPGRDQRLHLAMFDASDGSRIVGNREGYTIVEARPRQRALWNSFAFRDAFRGVRSALYFHFPPAKAPHPALVYVPDIIPTRSPGSFPWYASPYYAMQKPLLRSTEASIVTLSHSERQSIVDAGYAAAERVHIVRLGLDSPWDPTIALDEPASGQSVASSDYCLVVGRLTRRKNLSRLLDAWNLVPDAPQLLLVGPCESPEVLRRVQAHPSARYLGRVPEQELDLLFKGAALVVNASVAEGFGLPVAEALARGVRVAASMLPSFLEIGALAPQKCHYFDPNSIESIAGVVQDALNGPAVSSEDSDRIRAEFNWANAATDVLRALERTADGP